ncbi:MAG: FkbM family methyltransferase [Vicinamibacteraceae bacterium]
MTHVIRLVVVAHDGATLDGSDATPLRVVTPAAPGAAAISFVPDSVDGIGPAFGVGATILVERGRVRVTSFDRPGGDVIDQAILDAGTTPGRVELIADAPAGLVLLSNAADDGASRVTVLALERIDAPATDHWPASLSEPQVAPGWSHYYATLGNTLAEKARLRRHLRSTEPFAVTWADGLQFHIAPSDQLSRVVYVSGTYEPHTLRLLRSWLAPGAVFVDAGANAGVVSIAAARWVGPSGRVISLEPSAREFARLVDHVGLNGLSQVTPIRAAVTDASGWQTLRVAADPCGGLNTLGDAFAYPGLLMAGVEDVATTSLDALVADQALIKVDVIKLDVEGSEAAALRGGAATLATHRPVVVVEVCAASLTASGSSVHAVDSLLRAAGYVCFEIDDATGALQATAGLSDTTDRNVVAMPVERADALLAAAGGSS